MDNYELQKALFNQRSIILKISTISEIPNMGELNYKRVSAIIYRVKNGKLCVSAEIEDKCGHSVTIVDPKNIRYEEE